MERILHGPELHVPVPRIPLGRKLYEAMKEMASVEILYVEMDTEKRTTYKEFLALSCRLARSLQKFGCKQNDVIMVTSENNSLYFVPVVASLFLGMISALVNQNYTQSILKTLEINEFISKFVGEFTYTLEIYQPKIVFCSKKTSDIFVSRKENCACIEPIVVLEDEDVDGYDNLTTFMDKYSEKDLGVDQFTPVNVDPFEQTAVMLCSTCTTGMPKAVIMTHDNIAMRANQLTNPMLNLTKCEIISLVVPNFHTFGLMINLTSMLKGNLIVIMKRFQEELFLRAIEKYKINNLHIVPTIAIILVKTQILQRFDVSTVEEIFCAGAPLSGNIEEKIGERFPHLKRFRQGYGMAETTFVVTITPTGRRKAGSSGKIVPGTSIFVRDVTNGNSLGPNQRGEICLKGRFVTKGSYRNLEATKATFINGWVRNGDVGHYDEDGYFFIVDRIKDLIKYKEFQVSPAEIEDFLTAHPKIKAACVVGKPDEMVDELPTAFVVKQPGSDVTEEEIVEFVAGQISKTKHLPGGVYFVQDLPKTPSGKVTRRTLRESFFT